MKIINYKNLAKPSNILRNFATEPASWDWFRVAALALGLHDWQFEIDFLAPDRAVSGPMWHVSGSVNTVNIYTVAQTNYVISLCKDGNTTNNVSITFRPLEHGGYGRYKIRVTKIGDVATVYINEISVGSYSGFGQYYCSAAPYTGLDTNLYGMSLVDLTLQKTVSSYPTAAEHLRLITSINVQKVDGYLEAANPAALSRIDTAIDLRGLVSSYTVVVDAELVAMTAPGQHQELAGQGTAYQSVTLAIASLALHYYSTTYAALMVSQEISGARVARSFVVPHSSAGRHRVAGVVSLNLSARTTTLACYLDSVLLGSQTYAGLPTGIAAASATRYTFMANSTVGYAGKLYAGELFNEVLAAEQIANLSN